MVSGFREERSTGQFGASALSGISLLHPGSWAYAPAHNHFVTPNLIPASPLSTWATLLCLSELESGFTSH